MPAVNGYLGRMVKDPELKKTQGGEDICKFRFASDEGYGDKKETMFIPCVAWRKTASTVANYLRKGDSVLIEGKWENKPWKKDEKGYEIPNWQYNVYRVTFLPKGKDQSDSYARQDYGVRGVSHESVSQESYGAALDGFAEIGEEEDLPF